ncbi:cupredoxin domain-containing protein [Paenibacillus protaetiae]|nr:cupredoxin domain-containing protein [Paenibacillus protaetiae]
MLFNAGSLMMIGLIELYFNFIGFQKRSVRLKRVGLRSAVLSAIAAGLAFGAVLAQSFDMPFIGLLSLAALFGAVAGASGGLAYGQHSSVNGGLAGLIAGLIGTVLGSLFFSSGTVVLITALLFVMLAFLIQRTADGASTATGTAPAGKPRARMASNTSGRRTAVLQVRKPSYRSSYVLAACAVVLFTSIIVLQDKLQLGEIGLPQMQVAVMDDENNMQVATIDVIGAGFAPKVTEFEANAMIKIVFNVKGSAGNGLKIVSSDLNFSADVKPGENIFLLNNPQPGNYTIEIDGKGKAGTFVVKPAAKL